MVFLPERDTTERKMLSEASRVRGREGRDCYETDDKGTRCSAAQRDDLGDHVYLLQDRAGTSVADRTADLPFSGWPCGTDTAGTA